MSELRRIISRVPPYAVAILVYVVVAVIACLVAAWAGAALWAVPLIGCSVAEAFSVVTGVAAGGKPYFPER